MEYTWSEFKKIKPIKEGLADIDDIVLCPINMGGISNEELLFAKVVCTGYCLPDEFWGKRVDNGKPIGWGNNDPIKIISKQIEI